MDTDSRQDLCADLFKYYWLEPEELLATCPGLYAWMDELVGAADDGIINTVS